MFLHTICTNPAVIAFYQGSRARSRPPVSHMVSPGAKSERSNFQAMRSNIMNQRVSAAPADMLAFAVLTALCIIAGLTFLDYGQGWDDYAHSHYGELLYSYYATGFADKRAFEFSNLFYYGGGFDLAASILDRFAATDLFESRRLMGAIVGILGLIVVWRLARRVGGPIAGAAALILLAITFARPTNSSQAAVGFHSKPHQDYGFDGHFRETPSPGRTNQNSHRS